MRILLHIGTGKTGSTAVQNISGAARDYLKSVGILYPETLGHSNHEAVSVYASEYQPGFTPRKAKGVNSAEDLGVFRRRLRERLTEEMQASNCHTVLVSNEHLAEKVRTPEAARLVHHLFDAVATEYQVLLYVKRQDLFAADIYSELVRMGFGGDFDNAMTQQRTADLLNYRIVADTWAKKFGADNVMIRVYERDRLIDRDILSDVFGAFGIEGVDIEKLRSHAMPEHRTTLSAINTDFLRQFNLSVRDIRANPPTPQHKASVDFLNSFPRGRLIKALETGGISGPKFSMPRARAEEMLAYYAEDNAYVQETYGLSEFGPKFPEQDPGTSPELFCCTLEQAHEIYFGMLIQFINEAKK